MPFPPHFGDAELERLVCSLGWKPLGGGRYEPIQRCYNCRQAGSRCFVIRGDSGSGVPLWADECAPCRERDPGDPCYLLSLYLFQGLVFVIPASFCDGPLGMEEGGDGSLPPLNPHMEQIMEMIMRTAPFAEGTYRLTQQAPFTLPILTLWTPRYGGSDRLGAMLVKAQERYNELVTAWRATAQKSLEDLYQKARRSLLKRAVGAKKDIGTLQSRPR